MKNDKEKWIGEVFNSMQGSRRAKPAPDLFAKIESRLQAPEARIIPMMQIKIAAVAAVLLLVLNTIVLQEIVTTNQEKTSQALEEYQGDHSLISNYKIYED